MMLTDIIALKSMLDIDPDDHSEDTKILFCATWAGRIIDMSLNRPLVLMQRTEFPRPTNTPKLTLKARPVYSSPAPQVYLDDVGLYGQSPTAFSQPALVYGQDFGLQIDNDDGTQSLSGILIRAATATNSGYPAGIWPKPIQRRTGMLAAGFTEGFGSIKVIYTGGYSLDTLPPEFRAAADLLVSRLLYLFPHGMELSGDSYEDKALSFIGERKNWLLSLVRPLLYVHRNWTMA